VEALKEVLAENPIYFKDQISLVGRQGGSGEVHDALYEAMAMSRSPGTKSVYPKTLVANGSTNDRSVLLKNGHIRTVNWPAAS
jgi:hypothetical protein